MLFRKKSVSDEKKHYLEFFREVMLFKFQVVLFRFAVPADFQQGARPTGQ